MRRGAGAFVLAAALLAGGGAGGHPHVWVTGGADFEMDAEGQLAKLHITWIYDEFASLYMINYLEVDQDRDQVLSEDDKKVIIADQTNWPDDFPGDSYLYVDGRKRALGKPENPDTRILESGQVEVTFARAVLEPFRPAADGDVVVKVYDPTFYYAYEVTDPPEVHGPEGHGCTAAHEPVDPSNPALEALRVELSELGRDETPDQPDVGAVFADDLRLRCG